VAEKREVSRENPEGMMVISLRKDLVIQDSKVANHPLAVEVPRKKASEKKDNITLI
jgi:hypothetical protein